MQGYEKKSRFSTNISLCLGNDADWSGARLHHQPAHAGHQHSITLFTARLQQRQPLPTKNRVIVTMEGE